MNLVESFSEFKNMKNIDRRAMMRVLEDVLRSLIRKKYGSDENFNVIVNADTGDLELWRVREIVPDGEVTDELSQIAESEAKIEDEDYEVGDEAYQQLTLDKFGRRAVQAARQTLLSRIMELQKDEIYRRYIDRVGDLVTCEVNQPMRREIIVFDDATGYELVLPKNETIKRERFNKGDIIRAVITKVEMKNNNPSVIISRADESFLAKLLEQEVPEIEDGIIEVKKVVRIPGERAKVAVESYDERIDPVGACVGMKGSRIHGIVRELHNENIDIIPFTTNDRLLIQRSITPARPSEIELDTERRVANVYLDQDQVSLAIGKGGSNIKLASRLTDYEINVFRNDQTIEVINDVDLEQFADEIDSWILDALKDIGLDTARSVLNLDAAELVRRTDLEEETVNDLVKILQEELDRDED